MIKKPTFKKQRTNIAPASPRFLPSSQMVGERENKPEKPKAKKSKKPNLAGKKGRIGSFGKTTGRGGINYGRGGGKGMRTSKSCKS